MFEPTRLYAPYAGIGARETPEDVLSLMTAIAKLLDDRGYVLRSGGAEGADKAFDSGTSGMSRPEIYLPWNGFEGQHLSPEFTPTTAQLGNALKMAEQYHPNWSACSAGARKMMVRNCFQILGLDLNSPAKFVICWTKDGKASGGTGQALRIAEDKKISIFNLHDLEMRAIFYQMLDWPAE